MRTTLVVPLIVAALALSAGIGSIAHADPVHHFELQPWHGCAANDCNTVWCWGGHEFVYGGDKGVTSTFAQREPYQVGAGDRHSCVNWRDVSGPSGFGARGIIDCWGPNDYGQIDVPPEHDWRQLSVGSDHSCATDWTHHAICWGRDDQHQVSGTPVVDLFATLSAGINQTCGVSRRINMGTHDGEAIACWGKTSGGIAEVAASDLPGAPSERFTKVSAGFEHTCALSNEGDVYCWGSDDNGQLAPRVGGVPQNKIITLETGEEISQVTYGLTYLDVSAGTWGTCAVFRYMNGTGGVHCWGLPFDKEMALWSDVGDSDVLPIPYGFRPDTAQLTNNEACTLGHQLDASNQPIGDAILLCYQVFYAEEYWTTCDPNDATCPIWELVSEVDEEQCI